VSIRARLLCAECKELKQIKEYTDERRTAILKCGHQRTTALLPASGVSIESLNTAAGLRLFPVDVKAKL
jgi:hypothetical protein